MTFSINKIACAMLVSVLVVLFFPSDASAQRCETARDTAKSNAYQIKGCVETLLKERPTDPFLTRDAACINIYRAIQEHVGWNKGRKQTFNDKFCRELVDAQKQIYGVEPYWSSCIASNSNSVSAIETCTLGVIRNYFVLHPREIQSCDQMKEIHVKGQIQGTILKKNVDGANAKYLECVLVHQALLRLKKRSESPCFFGNRQNFDNTFKLCMAGKIVINAACKDLQSKFNELYYEVNGGYIPTYHPKFDVPSCQFIDSLRPAPKSVVTDPVEVPLASKPTKSSQALKEVDGSRENPQSAIDKPSASETSGSDVQSGARNQENATALNPKGLSSLIWPYTALIIAAVILGMISNAISGKNISNASKRFSGDDQSVFAKLNRTEDIYLVYNPLMLLQQRAGGLWNAVSSATISLVFASVGWLINSLVYAFIIFQIQDWAPFGIQLIWVIIFGWLYGIYHTFRTMFSHNWRKKRLRKDIQALDASDHLLAFKASSSLMLQTLSGSSNAIRYLSGRIPLVTAPLLYFTAKIFNDAGDLNGFVVWYNKLFFEVISLGNFSASLNDTNAWNLISEEAKLDLQFFGGALQFILVAVLIPRLVRALFDGLRGYGILRGNIFQLGAALQVQLLLASLIDNFRSPLSVARVRYNTDTGNIAGAFLDIHAIKDEIEKTARDVKEESKSLKFNDYCDKSTAKFIRQTITVDKFFHPVLR